MTKAPQNLAASNKARLLKRASTPNLRLSNSAQGTQVLVFPALGRESESQVPPPTTWDRRCVWREDSVEASKQLDLVLSLGLSGASLDRRLLLRALREQWSKAP